MKGSSRVQMIKQFMGIKRLLSICLILITVIQTFVVQGTPIDNQVIQVNKNNYYIHEEEFKKDYDIQGVFSEIHETFSIDEWNVKECLITLNYSITPLADEYLSHMTLSINGTRFYSERLKYGNKSRQQLQITIPKEYLKEGTNTITLENYIRTEEGLPCVDDVAAANWMNIYKESVVEVKYKPTTQIQNIADFYKAITSIYSLEYEKSLVAVPSHPSDHTLSVALNTLAGLAPRATLNYNQIEFEEVRDLDELEDKEFVIYVSTLAELPSQFKDLLESRELEEAKQAGLMKLINLQTNKHILLIVGDEPEALTKIGQLMGNPDLMSQLKDKEKWVKASDDVANRLEKDFQYYELTQEGSYVKGAFRRATEFYVDLPKNRILTDSSQIYLKMRYSENLDFERSLVTVYINDYPVGSKKLSLAQANEDELILDIPLDIKIAGGFNVKVAFDLEINDLWCTLRQGETPWAFVSNESMLKLNTKQNSNLKFEHYPAPFVSDHQFNQVNIVIPDEIGKTEYELLRSLVLTLGRFVKDNTGSLEVTRVSSVTDLSEDNLIVVGTFKDNKMIQDLNEGLFFKFSQDGETLLSNEKQNLEPEYSKTLGTAQLLASPYTNDGRALLVISGVNEKGMLEAASYLGTLEGLWHIYGDSYIANEEIVTAYRFKKDPINQFDFKETMSEREDLIPLGSAILVVGTLLALMSVLLINKHRKGGKR